MNKNTIKCLSVDVCLSVTLVDHDHIGSKSWKLIARTISPTSSRNPKVIHPLPAKHGEILGRVEVGLALVRSFGTASATPLCLRRSIVPLLLDHTDIASVLHNKSASRGHLCNSTAFLSHSMSLHSLSVSRAITRRAYGTSI